MKQSTEPPINISWNPPKKAIKNFKNQCIFFGGVIKLGPNSSRLLSASSEVNPEGRDYKSVNNSAGVITCQGFWSNLKLANGSSITFI